MSSSNSHIDTSRSSYIGDTKYHDRIAVEAVLMLMKASTNLIFGIAKSKDDFGSCHIVVWNTPTLGRVIREHIPVRPFTFWDLLRALKDKGILKIDLDLLRRHLKDRHTTMSGLRFQGGSILPLWTVQDSPDKPTRLIEIGNYSVFFSDRDQYALWPLVHDHLLDAEGSLM